MTGREFISEMMAECRKERGEIEDILNAFGDLVIERLNNKENIPIKGLGAFEFVNGADRPVRFHFAKEAYARLNIRPKIYPEKCIKCGINPPRPGRRKCQPCVAAEERARRIEKRQKKKA